MAQPSRKRAARAEAATAEARSVIPQLINAVLFTVSGAFAGQLIQAVPPYTSLWGIVACLCCLLAVNFLSRMPPRLRPAVGIGLAACAIFSVYKAAREYVGANYPMNYRVCGAPRMQSGYMGDLFVGLELENPNKVDLIAQAQTDKHSLTAGQYNATTKPNHDVVTIHPSNPDPDDDVKYNDYVTFDPPIAPKDLTGHFHQEFKFGTKTLGLKRTLIIDGELKVFVNEDGGYLFGFKPSPDSTSGYDGVCDITRHIKTNPPM